MTRPFPESCNCGALDCRWCSPLDYQRPPWSDSATCQVCDGEKVLYLTDRIEKCLSCDGTGWVPVVSEADQGDVCK